MIDTIRLKLNKFKVINSDNFFCKRGTEKFIPFIDTLNNNQCYSTIFSEGNYQEYHLKSYIKYEPHFYRPSRIVVKDIPVNPIRFWLEIEVSLPKVLYGHNFYEIQQTQFETVINSLYDMLLQFGIQIDLNELRTTTSISRIDFCKNILIRSTAKNFIQLLLKFQKDRSHTYDKFDTSVLFANKQQGLIAYDKIEEITKVLRDKSYNNRASKEYEVAKILNSHKRNVIRIEHRLLNRQTIKREIGPITGSYPLTFENIFKTDISSRILLKHWSKAISEEKLKLLLLGEKQVSFIFDELKKSAEHSSKKFNPFSTTYIKLLYEVGEKETNRRILSVKSSGTLNNHKKQFLALAQQVFFTIRGWRTISALQNHYRTFRYSLSLLFQLN